MIDPLGKILVEVRSDPVVAAITTKIRGGEPAPGDALGVGTFQPFVVLSRLASQREKGRAPVQQVKIGARCYAATYQLATALAGAVSDAIHNVGPRISPSGVLVYRTYEDVGMGTSKDPDTGQPVAELVIQVWTAV